MQGTDLRAGVSVPVIGPDTYTDYKSLPTKAKDNSPEALKAAARQFESVFLHLWLKSMRDANSAFSEGSYLDSPAMETHQQMLDGELAVKLSDAGGIGLAEVIERQLSGLSAPVQRDQVVQSAPPGRNVDKVSNEGSPILSMARSAANGLPEESDRRGFLLQLAGALDQVLDGTPVPKLGVLAQAVLETGWGRHVIRNGDGESSHNLFGIKATGWQGDSVATSTREFIGGRFLDKTEAFRVYDSMQSAVTDYVSVLQGSSRYSRLFDSAQSTVGGALDQVRHFAQTLQQGGYATDPRYADKIVEVARSIIKLTGGL